MKPFVINTFEFVPFSGGIKVMHKLCDILNKNGFEAYLTPIHTDRPFYVNQNYYTPVASREMLKNLDDCILVYPEGITHNPLNGKNVVRWMLGPAIDDIIITYGKNDLIYWYMNYYYTDKLGQKENELYVVEFHDDIFKDLKNERNGSCFTIRKGKPEKFVHPNNSIEISYYDAGNLPYLIDLFNKTEKFYCYDTYTFLLTQAALCGCISIAVPIPNMSKEEWYNSNRLFKYGVAYGEEETFRAINTLPLLHDEIKKVKNEMENNVIKFAEHCYLYFK